MQSSRYFVEYTEYSGFGQLTVTRETFPNWQKMQFFLRQLHSSQLLNFGEISTPDTEKVAA